MTDKKRGTGQQYSKPAGIKSRRDNPQESRPRRRIGGKVIGKDADFDPERKSNSYSKSRTEGTDTRSGGYRGKKDDARFERGSGGRFKKSDDRTHRGSRYDKSDDRPRRGARFDNSDDRPQRSPRFEKSGDRSQRGGRFDHTDDRPQRGKTAFGKRYGSDDASRGQDRHESGGYKGKRTERRDDNYSGRDQRQGKYSKDYQKGDRTERRPGTKKPFGKSADYVREAPEYQVLKKAAPPKKEVKEGIRLNRYLANAGISSRREADVLIERGEVKVNGKVVTEMGVRVMPGDEIRHKNKVISREKVVYVLLNKPKDFITTMDDPEGRKTVMDLVATACGERIFPVGRLDRQTTGLLLLTNDGELTERLTHPSFQMKKIYQVELNKPITEADFNQIIEGLTLDDGEVKVDDLAIVSEDKTTLGIEVHVGRNRIVRRIFEHLGYEVEKLDRVVYAGLTKLDLPRGKWRYLSEKEVARLKKIRYKKQEA